MDVQNNNTNLPYYTNPRKKPIKLVLGNMSNLDYSFEAHIFKYERKYLDGDWFCSSGWITSALIFIWGKFLYKLYSYNCHLGESYSL